MNSKLETSWRAALRACEGRGGEVRPLVIEPPATKKRVAQVERALGRALPEALRRFFLEEAARVELAWFLPNGSEPPFVDIFSGQLALSLDALPELAKATAAWSKLALPDGEALYGVTWHDKLAIQEVGNGDHIAIDVGAKRGRAKPGQVVYLSHDGSDGHGIVLGRNLSDYLARHASLGGVGSEDAQWLPFVGDDGTLDPDCENAGVWRRWFGLPAKNVTKAKLAKTTKAASAKASTKAKAAAATEALAATGPKTVDELKHRLAAIRWCERCERGPTKLDVSVPLVWLSKWKEAKPRMGSMTWSNATLEAQNELTLWLHNHARDAYRTWNERSARVTGRLITELEPVWKKRQQELGLEPAFVASLSSMIRGAGMELEYLPFGHEVRFFLDLLPILEAGHLPCGWKGRWPSGALVVI